MKIFNIMLSRDLGGIQQVAVDYSEYLRKNGVEVINITSCFAKINVVIKPKHCLANLGIWCIVSRIYLWCLIKIYSPDIIIVHGNRAIIFALKIVPSEVKIIGVAHNYNFKHLLKCDYIISLTKDLSSNLLSSGVAKDRLIDLPNMCKIEQEYKKKAFSSPIVIGTIVRFVEKKGIKFLIKAISALLKKGYNVKLKIAGEGEKEKEIRNLITELSLENQVTLCGWISDRVKFFKEIDIFCLPSISEPFGIVVLESMEKSTPIVATISGGPQDIIEHGKEGILVIPGDSSELANGLEQIILNEENAQKMANAAYNKVKLKYSFEAVGKNLLTNLTRITKQERDINVRKK